MVDYENVKGRIYDIQGYAVHDGPGVRTTIYTKGCPLHCLWCHSPESQYYRLELGRLDVKCDGIEVCGNACINACEQGALMVLPPTKALNGEGMISKVDVDREKCNACLKCVEECIPGSLYASGWDTCVDDVYDRVIKDKVFFKGDGGITISGGEAMAQFDFTYNLAKRLKYDGIHICLDTTGFAPTEQFEKILPYIDLFLYDIKEMDTVKHKNYTGVSNELIIENAKFLAEHGGKLQIRMPIIPKLNDSEEDLRKAAEFCVSLSDAVKVVQLLPYHATGKGKYARLGVNYKLTNVEPPSDEYMDKLLKMFKDYGLPCQIH